MIRSLGLGMFSLPDLLVDKLCMRCLGRANWTRMALQESGTMSLIKSVGLISIVKMLTDADNCGKLNMNFTSMSLIFFGMLFVHFCYRSFGSVLSRTKWHCHP